MRFLPAEASAQIDRVLAAKTDNFVELVAISGLVPAIDFKYALLDGVDFRSCDLAGFDFTGTRFRNCDFSGARLGRAKFDDADFSGCNLTAAQDWHAWTTARASQVAGGMRKIVANSEAGEGRHEPTSPLTNPIWLGAQTSELLDRALTCDEIFLVYQPKISIRHEKVVGAEVLIRWDHPVHGAISPHEFMVAFESSNISDTLARWVLNRVIDDQQRLFGKGYRFPIFINLPAELLANANFIAEVISIAAESDAYIGFEITEAAVIAEPEKAMLNLRMLAEQGIKIAVDEYGAGLSSLAYLKQLPVCELKIDRMFVAQLTSSNRDPLIVRSTIDLAHALELEVTADGVETPAALSLLAVMGCDTVQGYLISRPLPVEGFIRFLDESAHKVLNIGRSNAIRPGAFWSKTEY